MMTSGVCLTFKFSYVDLWWDIIWIGIVEEMKYSEIKIEIEIEMLDDVSDKFLSALKCKSLVATTLWFQLKKR